MLAIHLTYPLRKIGEAVVSPLILERFCKLFSILVFVEGGTKYLSYRHTDYKALAKRRRKLKQVEDLGQLATSFGQGLRALAST